VASSDFQPDRYNLEEILTRRYYHIPRFQRPYSWDPANLEDFWRDVFEDNDAGYFIGPMVGWRKKDAPHANVVDGQQRLTTITILLTVIRDAFAAFGEAKLADGVHGYIEREDRNNDPYFVLQPEDKAPYLNNGVLKHPRDGTAQPSTYNERNLATARAWLAAKVQESLAPDGAPFAKPSAVKALQSLRDKCLGLFVIWIEHTDEDDAYVLFETLNSRGKDLDVADLLKNLLLGKLKAKNAQADASRDKWDLMRSQLESVESPLDVDRYILHWWLSREEYVAARKLFGRIKTKVKTADDARERLGTLAADAPLYRDVFLPGLRNWKPEELEVKEALEALVTFSVVQPAPLLLALLRARRDQDVTLKHLRRSFEVIERYHFQSTAVAAASSSGGVSGMYARFARELSNAKDADEKVVVLQSLRKALVARVPDPAVFDAGFTALRYTDDFTRDKKLVQYVARRMHEASRAHRPAKPTLEHLLPQSTSGGTPVDVVGNIGNLIYLEETLNNELGHKPFFEKKKILAKHRDSYELDDVLDADTWGPTEIASRALRLAKLARESAWALK